nr:hypothetical protein [Tanacetum cinerariifolium]
MKLLEVAKKVYAVEVDKRMVEVLGNRVSESGFREKLTVTDIAKKEKNKAKRTKPNTRMERLQESQAKAIWLYVNGFGVGEKRGNGVWWLMVINQGIGWSWLLVCRWQRRWRGRWWAQLSLFGICEHGGEIVYGIGLVCHGGGLCGDVSEEGGGQLDEGLDIGGGGSVFGSGIFFWRHAVREEWRSLRFQDFKKVNEYSSALFRICSQLKFYGQSVIDADMLEKTYSTFHASNMTLLQQYQLHKFTRYSELNAYLLVAEQNNELLMKNHQSRHTGSLAYPEVNATKNDPKTFMKNGQVYTHGRGFTCGSGQRTNKNDPRNNKAKNVVKRKHNGESGPSQNNDGSCFTCGSSNHWAKSSRTTPHHYELYQASLKEKDGEVNLVDRVDFENNDLDTSDFLSGDTELNT